MMFVTEIKGDMQCAKCCSKLVPHGSCRVDLDFFSGCTEAEFRVRNPNCTITSSDEVRNKCTSLDLLHCTVNAVVSQSHSVNPGLIVQILSDYNMEFVTVWEAAFVSLGLFVLMWLGAWYGINRIVRQRHS
jgi:hypothetical protein